MDLRRPLSVVTPTLDGPVLQVLAGTHQPLTRQRIADLVEDASEAGVRKVLRRLVHQGVVHEQQIGHQFSYRANRDHLSWVWIEGILGARVDLERRIRGLVESWDVPPITVAIFGSTTGHLAAADSDVDILIYRSSTLTADVDRDLTGLHDAVLRWTGNEADLLEVDARTLLHLVADDAEVLRSPRTTVFGPRLEDVVPSRRLARVLRESGDHPSSATHGPVVLDAHHLAELVATELRVRPGLQRTLAELGELGRPVQSKAR